MHDKIRVTTMLLLPVRKIKPFRVLVEIGRLFIQIQGALVITARRVWKQDEPEEVARPRVILKLRNAEGEWIRDVQS